MRLPEAFIIAFVSTPDNPEHPRRQHCFLLPRMSRRDAVFAMVVAACLIAPAHAQQEGCLGMLCPSAVPVRPDAPPVVAARPSLSPSVYAPVREERQLLRAGEPFTPLTAQQKWRVFVRHTYAPSTFINAGLDAGYTQATRGQAGYGQGAAGFGRRLGASLAVSESDTFFERFLFPTLLHQDPRYFHAPL